MIIASIFFLDHHNKLDRVSQLPNRWLDQLGWYPTIKLRSIQWTNRSFTKPRLFGNSLRSIPRRRTNPRLFGNERPNGIEFCNFHLERTSLQPRGRGSLGGVEASSRSLPSRRARARGGGGGSGTLARAFRGEARRAASAGPWPPAGPGALCRFSVKP